jgi:hypothetical protein
MDSPMWYVYNDGNPFFKALYVYTTASLLYFSQYTFQVLIQGDPVIRRFPSGFTIKLES